MGSSFPILYFAPWPSCLCFSSFFDGMQPALVKSKLRMFEPSLWLSSGTQRVVVGTVVWRFLANIFWETGQTTGIEFNQFTQRVHAHQEPYVLGHQWVSTRIFWGQTVTSKVYIFCGTMALPGNFGLFFLLMVFPTVSTEKIWVPHTIQICPSRCWTWCIGGRFVSNILWFYDVISRQNYVVLPVVPHKVVAEVSKIWNL